MKKNFKSILFLVIFTLGIKTVSAQFYSVGGHLSRISGGSIIKNFGLHASGEYMFDEKTGVVASLGYFLPHTSNSELTLNARSSAAQPQSITINSKDKLTGFQLGIFAKRFFVNEYDEEGFGLYGLAGIGYSAFSIKSKLDNYDEGTYGNFERSQYESEKGSNFTFNLGLGAQIQMSSGLLYFEPVICIPGNSNSDGTAVEVQIPTTIQFNLGYRILLDN